MADIDRLSRRVPVLCKVAPSVADVHIEDVHRAGGIMGILGELDRAGLLNRDVRMVHAESLEHALSRHDIMRTSSNATREFFSAAPGGVPTQVAFSQSARFRSLDEDRAKGVIRDADHAFSKDGGLAVLSGNIARDGSHREDGGRRRERPQVHRPRARLREPGRRGAGHPRRQGRRRRRRRHPLRRSARRPGHAGDALSDELSEVARPRQGLRPRHRRALLGRHLRPLHRPRLAGSGGRRRHRPRSRTATGSRSTFRRARSTRSSTTRRWAKRRAAMEAKGKQAWKPARPRPRKVSKALRAYAAFATSASRGAVREVP